MLPGKPKEIHRINVKLLNSEMQNYECTLASGALRAAIIKFFNNALFNLLYVMQPSVYCDPAIAHLQRHVTRNILRECTNQCKTAQFRSSKLQIHLN